MAETFELVVIGGGIVGLATARAVAVRAPGTHTLVIEKEDQLLAHQSSRNSGVIHSGIYYPPGSLKARFAIAGSRSMTAYARHKGVPHRITGKLIAATRPEELPRLDSLHRRAVGHGLEVTLLDASEARREEPHLAAIAALHVASTGIIDFAAAAHAMAQDAVARGAEIRTGTEVLSVGDDMRVHTDRGDVVGTRIVNCAGLHSDRVARSAGVDPGGSIIPFRGEYYELGPAARDLVRGLIYPVPDPDFPFLGVHLTRDIHGGVHAGPNAVLALSREGYRWRDVSPRDVMEMATNRGLRSLASTHGRQGIEEMRRSLRRSAFVSELQRLVPAISGADLARSPAGVRAQAMTDDGSLVDDFMIREVRSPGGELTQLHVLNAPSPAATASLEIGSELARRLGF